MRAHSGWTRARLNQGKPRLGQGTAGGADAGHEQGSSAAGAHGKARARQTRVRQWATVLEQGAAAGGARLGQGMADTGPAVGISGGAGCGC